MLSIEDAQRLILELIMPKQSEEVPVLQGLGRIISEPVYSPWDIPSAATSAMDGYAFSHAACKADYLKVSGFIAAGMEGDMPVPAGTAVKIMTGAPLPPGCDTVVPIEEVELNGEVIRFKRRMDDGSNVKKQGDDVQRGELTIAAGALLGPQEIGMLVSLGKASVVVYGKPDVSVLATGDELLPAGSEPFAGKIINSNSYSIAAQVLEAGGNPLLLGIAGDNTNDTRLKILEGSSSDLLVTTGGVSVGDKDYVKETILSLGGEIKFWKVNMKPGKPVVFAVLNGTPLFALPGNPVASMVAFEMFVRPVMLKMMGHRQIFRPAVTGIMAEELKNSGDRPQIIFVRISQVERDYLVSTMGRQSSSRLASATGGNGYIKLAPDQSLVPGDEVQVSQISSIVN